MEKIGLIGLGNMGKGVCNRLIVGGIKPWIFDLSETAMNLFENKAYLASSPEDVFTNSDVTLLSLPNSKVVEMIVEKLLKLGMSGKTIIDMSTSNPISTRKLYDLIKDKGGNLIDCPLSSGPKEAWEGTMSIIVGGDEEVVEKNSFLFRTIAKEYTYVGKIGTAHLLKLAKNWAGLMQALVYAQIFAVMEKYEISPEDLYTILDSPALSNWIFHFYGQKYAQKQYSLDFALALGFKDITYMKALCEAADIPSYVLQGAIEMCQDTLEATKDDDNIPDMSYVNAYLREISVNKS